MGMVSFNTVNKLYPSQNIQYYCTYSHVVLLNLNTMYASILTFDNSQLV